MNDTTMQECTDAGMRAGVARVVAFAVRAVVQLSIVALTVVAAACAHGQAKTLVELPPLAMPDAPPRIIEATELQPPPVVSLPDEPRTNLPPRPTTAPRVDAPRTAEPSKTDQPATTTTEPSRPADEPPRSNAPTTLQTTPTQREGEVERRIRILIAQAMNDLNRVNYQALNADARNQYDTAKRFAIQAEDAVRTRNLVFASNLADKAAGLAAQLLGR